MSRVADIHEWAFLDTKKFLGDWSRNFRYIKINEIEYALNEESVPDLDDMEEQLVVALGGSGCRHLNLTAVPEKEMQTIDVSGAGDTFMAAFATKVFETEDVGLAMNFANSCSSKVVQERGVTTV